MISEKGLFDGHEIKCKDCGLNQCPNTDKPNCNFLTCPFNDFIKKSDAVARVQELLEQKKKELKEKFRESDLYYTQEIRNVIDEVLSQSQEGKE